MILNLKAFPYNLHKIIKNLRPNTFQVPNFESRLFFEILRFRCTIHSVLWGWVFPLAEGQNFGPLPPQNFPPCLQFFLVPPPQKENSSILNDLDRILNHLRRRVSMFRIVILGYNLQVFCLQTNKAWPKLFEIRYEKYFCCFIMGSSPPPAWSGKITIAPPESLSPCRNIFFDSPPPWLTNSDKKSFPPLIEGGKDPMPFSQPFSFVRVRDFSKNKWEEILKPIIKDTLFSGVQYRWQEILCTRRKKYLIRINFRA